MPNFKLYYKAMVTETILYWHENRHINQKKNKETKNNARIYSQLIFNKGAKNRQQGKNILFLSINCVEKTGYSYEEE